MGDLSVKKPQRNIGADVIRCMAFFTVVSVHFMSYAGFYENSVEGEKMLLMIFARSFFIICVPLYMMLSGYLSSNKKPNLAYYKKFGKTYFTYSLCSLCCILFSALVLKQQWSFRNIVFGILDFTAAPYAWYVEMYLGLFLIIPFLNVLYYNIDTQKAKKRLDSCYGNSNCIAFDNKRL